MGFRSTTPHTSTDPRDSKNGLVDHDAARTCRVHRLLDCYKAFTIAPANVDRLIFDRLQKFDGSRILIGVFRIKTHLDEAMLSVVFWNLKKRPRSEIVGRMARERAADLVILTECDEDDDLMLQSLRDSTGKQFRNMDDLSQKVRVFSCLPISMVRPYSNSACGRISIQRIVLAKTEFYWWPCIS